MTITSAAAPGLRTPRGFWKYRAQIFALFWNSMPVASHQPTLGWQVLCRCMGRSTFRLSSMSWV